MSTWLDYICAGIFADAPIGRSTLTTNTTGTDNVPGTTRSSETLTVYSMHSDTLALLYHRKTFKPTSAKMPALLFGLYTEAIRFESNCGGTATYIGVLTDTCSDNPVAVYDTWYTVRAMEEEEDMLGAWRRGLEPRLLWGLSSAEGRWGTASLVRGWSPDGEAADRLVCYGNIVQIIHDALQATPRYTVNVTRATGVARGTLAFGSTIAGEPGLLRDQVRLVRLQDSIRAWPDFDGQFPEPMRYKIYTEVRVRWLLLAAEAFGIKIHSLSISVQFLAQTNPETERSYFEDLHDIKNEAQFWTLLAKARALQVSCENCKEFI
ncbi:hypothetical protein DFH08DRAFT_973582 [Mycena albidolilacea]|uniref:Uncharacterized protein n=1 Tax=Mycena albidolilacea TaxID=1033008 RepID=A0AAD6Z8S1_9AGAR|nr:hypothetical protein DFH08DRAFT_973582 [Mycena albidolilacea]